MDWTPAGTGAQSASIKKKIPQRRWFLADPSLIHSQGHCSRYLLALSDELAKDGIEHHFVGNRHVAPGAVGGRPVRPFFSLTCEDARLSRHEFAFSRQPLDQWRRHSVSIIDGLTALDEEFGLQPTDVILLNTVRQWSLPGIIDWLECRPIDRCPKIAIVLHYTPMPAKNATSPATAEYRVALKRISGSSRRSKVFVFVDSDELAHEFGQLSDMPVQVVPIPHVGDIVRREAPKDGIRIVAAGPPRANKGFEQLPFVQAALKRTGRRGHVVVQGSSFQHDPGMARTITKLSRGGATLLPDALCDQQFRHLVATADLIVLPYRADLYHSQTSGVFAEAIGGGVPVIVPDHTWMARQIQRFGGGVVFDGTDAGLEQASFLAIKDIEKLTKSAKLARERWLDEHGPRHFLSVVSDQLEEMAGDRPRSLAGGFDD